MATAIQNNFRVRKNFAKIKKIIDIPNLIDIQKQSYEKFLQADIAAREARGRRPSGRLQVGLPDPGLQRDVARSSSSATTSRSRSTTSTSATSAA